MRLPVFHLLLDYSLDNVWEKFWSMLSFLMRSTLRCILSCSPFNVFNLRPKTFFWINRSTTFDVKCIFGDTVTGDYYINAVTKLQRFVTKIWNFGRKINLAKNFIWSPVQTDLVKLAFCFVAKRLNWMLSRKVQQQLSSYPDITMFSGD